MSRYLSDGERLIDFVLAYDLDTQDDVSAEEIVPYYAIQYM